MSRLEEMMGFLERDPSDSFARYAVALELRSAKRIDEAIEQLVELRRRDPAYVATYYQLGELYAQQESMQMARESFNGGIDVARAAGDSHTQSELQLALDELDDPD